MNDCSADGLNRTDRLLTGRDFICTCLIVAILIVLARSGSTFNVAQLSTMTEFTEPELTPLTTDQKGSVRLSLTLRLTPVRPVQ